MHNLAIRRIVAMGLVAVAATAPAFGQSKLDARVERTLEQIGSARVLVMMSSDASSAEPADFVAGLLGERGSHVQQIVDLPVVVVETGPNGIADLVESPQVARVVADHPAPPLLMTSLRTLRVDEVHSTGVFGAGYSVAVLDTGVDYEHPFFFGGRLRAEACFSTGTDESGIYSIGSLCRNGLGKDLTGGAGLNCQHPRCDHGTHVAGIAVGAQVSYDGNVISGVAPDAGLISIQIFTEFYNARDCGDDQVPCIRSFTSDQLRALRHVRGLFSEHSLEIASVNMSLGDGRHNTVCDSVLTDEVLALRESGILTVISSGNDGYEDAVNSPACISAAITVGASLKGGDDLDSSYSNTSAVVDFLAPGTGIVSAVSPGGYGEKTGTSMAAPHVAGLVALLKSQVPSASADEIESALRTTARRTADPRTGLALYVPDASAALDALDSRPVASASSLGDVGAASFAGIVGARRIIIRGGRSTVTMDGDVLAELISSALGSGATVRLLGESIYLAENRAGFNVDRLSRLMGALGSDTRLYLDEPVPPGGLR